ncbi:hypothetical protein Tco_0825114 [Tanacetum coccineum]
MSTTSTTPTSFEDSHTSPNLREITTTCTFVVDDDRAMTVSEIDGGCDISSGGAGRRRWLGELVVVMVSNGGQQNFQAVISYQRRKELASYTKKAKSKITKESLDDFDFNIPLENDHEIEAGKEFNPMLSNVESQEGENYVEPHVGSDRDMPKVDSNDEMNDTEKWIIQDPNTHWKIQKPILDQKKKKGEIVDPSKPKCPFKMRAVKMRDENIVHIRSLHDKHTCTRRYYLGSLVTSKWIAQRFEDKVRMNPDMKVVDLQEYQNVGSQYDRLVDYCDELKRSNPDTIVSMQVDPLANEKHLFNSYYVSIQQFKEGWKAGCKKIICMDGCFLKGICQGELLAAVGRDANNQIYLIAWVLVQVENIENWEWFLRYMSKDLDLNDGTGLALIFDGHKGILQGTDISQKDKKPSKKRQNRTRDGKVCEDEA